GTVNSNLRINRLISIVACITLVFGLLVLPVDKVQAEGTVSLDTLGAAYTQDFNTLAITGTTNTNLPPGWFLYETGTSSLNNGSYGAGTGSNNAGDTYSFGAAGNIERAFGGLLSGTLNPTIGAQFTNNTGGIITSLDIGYIGEQWRLGYSGRTENDRLDFQYSLDAASLSTGTWTDFDALDFVAPVSTGTVGAKNGNSIEFRTALSSNITGLTIPVGTTFWIRWKDFNAYSSDDGLAVDDLTLTANSYIPVVDPTPTVSSTIPGNGAVNIPINQNISLTFSEDVNVTGDWFDLSCLTSGDHTAIVSGGPTTFVLNPSTDLAFAETCTLTIHAAQVADADSNDPPDNMAADQSFSFTTMDDVCSLGYTPAFSIQGSGLTSPMSGTTVTTQGVVVGDYEGPGYGGFYLQEMTGDGDPATSDAIFIYHGYTLNTVNVGDVVRVTGKVSEYYSQTQVSATSPTSVVYCGTGTVAPTDVTLPFTSATQPEQYEGMLVRLSQTMYVTEHYELGRYGDVLVSANGRLQQPTNVEEPGEAALALQAANDLNQIVIEDAKTGQNADPIVLAREGLPLSASNTLRGGDTATGLVGVLNYTYSKYRVRPIYALGGYVNFEPTNLRPEAAPELAEGSRLRVAGMNLLNFFNTFTGCTNGVDGDLTGCRGAENQVEYDRQLPKTVAAIVGTNADVIGLVELENDGYGPDSAIQALVDALNAATAPDTYAFIDVDAGTGQINALGLDAIKVGMIYRTASVIPVGTTAALNSVEFVNGGDSDIRNRPA
ncbi:MAG: ExeM/NucH family extracellular endonuclease, partial [bacterium]